MSASMWHRDNGKMLVSTGNWLNGGRRIGRSAEPWFVMSKATWKILGTFPTHADAITYAHEQATRQALAARFNIPPENPVARAMQEGK